MLQANLTLFHVNRQQQLREASPLSEKKEEKVRIYAKHFLFSDAVILPSEAFLGFSPILWTAQPVLVQKRKRGYTLLKQKRTCLLSRIRSYNTEACFNNHTSKMLKIY